MCVRALTWQERGQVRYTAGGFGKATFPASGGLSSKPAREADCESIGTALRR